MASANREKEKLEAMRKEAHEQHTREEDESKRRFDEQYQKAQDAIHADRFEAHREVAAREL
jgi:hypothetical protein